MRPPSLWVALCLAATAPARAEPDDIIVASPRRPARVARTTTLRAAPPSLPAGWRALWDTDTGVPLRLYGAGLPSPGSASSAAAAERAARQTLADHISLLAPGARPSDFVLTAANHTSGGIRTVAFAQRARGLSVLGGQVSFRFKRDRLFVVASEAMPHTARAAPPTGRAAPARVRAAARAWIERDLGATATAGHPGEAALLPLVRTSGIELRVVRPVAVETRRPFSRQVVWLDAASAEPVARRSLVRSASGTLRYDTPDRWPGASRSAYPAAFATVSVDAVTTTSDALGELTWPGAAQAQVDTAVTGPFVRVMDALGTSSVTLSLDPDGEVIWSAAVDERADAQLTTFVHLNIAKQRARVLAPELAWLDQQVEALVNDDDTCNAYSDGDSLRFLLGDRFCGNTGRLPDLIYHEFGHSLHYQSIIPGAGSWNAALGEGASDYFAASITGDPGMGRGFFLTDAPLRQLDPENHETVWPDDIGPTPHATGLILAGALWDLRKALIADLDANAGAALADHLYYAVLERASDIPSAYVEVLAADDDDGDLSNGTPHACAIETAFGAHGLGDPSAAGLIGSPATDGLEVTLPISPPDSDCGALQVTSARLRWELRDQIDDSGELDMEPTSAGFRAALPEQPAGSVIAYRIELGFADGSIRTRPANAADPDYDLFVGETVPLYCTTFDEDPAADGWSRGGDWEWGAPRSAPGTGDPAAAYSGTSVFGIDLGALGQDGAYEPDADSYAQMPTVEVPEQARSVRLQYRRWLNVEDARRDVATISSSGAALWSNRRTADGDLHHADREWRFHDVDLGDGVVGGQVTVRFELASNEGVELGGWTIDDACVVMVEGPCETEACGGDAGPGPADDGGCGCAAGLAPGSGLPLALVLGLPLFFGQLGRRRRRPAGQRAQIDHQEGNDPPAEPHHDAGVDDAAPGL